MELPPLTMQLREANIPIFNDLNRNIREAINRESIDCNYFYSILTPLYEDNVMYVAIEVVTKYARFLIPINPDVFEREAYSGKSIKSLLYYAKNNYAYSMILAERYNSIPKVTVSSTKEGNINFRIGNVSFIVPYTCKLIQNILNHIEEYITVFLKPKMTTIMQMSEQQQNIERLEQHNIERLEQQAIERLISF